MQTNQLNIKQFGQSALTISFWLIIVSCSLLLVKNTIPYFTFDTNFPFLLERISLVAKPIWKYSFYIHIFAGMWCVLTALLQFSTYILKKRRAIHIWSGRVYVFVVLFLGAPTGLYMSYFAKGAYAEKFCFVFMALFWYYTTYKGLSTILKKDVNAHKKWMIRSYAMALTAVTFRIYHVIFFSLGMDNHLNYQVSLWISVFGNILLAELFLYYQNRKPISSSKMLQL